MAGKPRDGLFIATKVAGPGGGWFLAPVRDNKGRSIATTSTAPSRPACAASSTDYIDLYQTHWPDRGVPIDETMEALTRLIEDGKIRYVGCSNETAYGLTKSLWASETRGLARYETIQNNFSLLNRRFEDELAEVCRREQVSLLPYSPLAGGVLQRQISRRRASGRRALQLYNEGNPRCRRWPTASSTRAPSSRRRVSCHRATAGTAVATLAMAWTLTHDFVGSTIIGATHARATDRYARRRRRHAGADVLDGLQSVTKEIRIRWGSGVNRELVKREETNTADYADQRRFEGGPNPSFPRISNPSNPSCPSNPR